MVSCFSVAYLFIGDVFLFYFIKQGRTNLNIWILALEKGEMVRFGMTICYYGYELTKRYAEKGLADDTICADFTGTAGQSLGAFLPKGISLRYKETPMII